MKKQMVTLITGILIGAMMFGGVAVYATTQYIATKAEFKVLVNGVEFKGTTGEILVVEGRTYLPLRDMGMALGVSVNWNNELRQVEVGVPATMPTRTPAIRGTHEEQSVTTTAPNVEINGQLVSDFDTPLMRVGESVLIPARKFADLFGYDPGWDDETQTITYSNNRDTIRVTVDSLTYVVNGRSHNLSVPMQIINGRTMMPLDILKSINYTVIWNENRNTLVVNAPAQTSTTAPQTSAQRVSLTHLRLNREYKAADGMIVVLKSIDVTQRQASTQYRISYKLTNGTSDKKLDEGTFKLFFTNDTGENQFGFFDSLFPGDSVEREYTFEALSSLTPLVLEYNHASSDSATNPLEGAFFRNTPINTALHWRVQ